MERARRPEILAPAGDRAALLAAIRAGADAVYFGLEAHNARARAENFRAHDLAELIGELHDHGMKGYLTLNTLVFDDELPALESAARAAAEAGVDAVIVQDLGVARLVRAVAPGLALHASTQMTCTDARAIELARELGVSRVILPRELSLEEIARLRRETAVELEVFVHGALCVAYSGQCLTSEAIGGRSANRGACAQACRLPYELLVDGTARELGERAYLLSPQDLEASALVPALVELGISALKIEGRLKGPEYVAAATKLYRGAVDAALGLAPPPDEPGRERALQTFTRGSGPGFLLGVDHQRLVEGRSPDHRGLEIGQLLAVRPEVATRTGNRKTWLALRLSRALATGDGILLEGGREGAGELGGRVWALRVDGAQRDSAAAAAHVEVWLGPKLEASARWPAPPRRVFRTSAPALERAVLAEVERAPRRLRLDLSVRGALGEAPVFSAQSEDGRRAEVLGEVALAPAAGGDALADVLGEKLGRLGDSAFMLGTLTLELPHGAYLPPGSVNRARRALLQALRPRREARPTAPVSLADLLARARPPERGPPAPGLFVLCRDLPQAEAALEAGADGVYLDFLELVGVAQAVALLRQRGARFVGLAPPRIRKPGEERIDRRLLELAPDALLVRGLGALSEVTSPAGLRIGDFSLNVTNRLSALEVLSRGLSAFTPSYDLDQAQLLALLRTGFGPFAELVVHHPMPLFHMEHCVFAALLSSGKDFTDCGRPCERHALALKDRAGMEHPVLADVGCRNTVFHAAAQSAAHLVPAAQRAGVGRFRVELVRETAVDTARIVRAYRGLLAGTEPADQVWRSLRAEGGYGVVRGSLRVLDA